MPVSLTRCQQAAKCAFDFQQMIAIHNAITCRRDMYMFSSLFEETGEYNIAVSFVVLHRDLTASEGAVVRSMTDPSLL